MPREARIILPDCPHHIIQRGHNRQAVFAGAEDYGYYLENLREWKEELGCRVYAYCLMTNHVHLVIDPGDDPSRIGRLMKRVAGRQTRYVNRLEKRSGTLWEGRYRSSPISAADYLLACCRYVELNPLRAGLVDDPEDYPWSSCPVKTGRKEQNWLDLDEFYLGLAEDGAKRRQRYRQWLRDSIPATELKLIREAAASGHPTASGSFVAEIEKKIGRRLELRGPGRPRKEK